MKDKTIVRVKELIKENNLKADIISEIDYCLIYAIAQADLLREQLKEMKGE